MLPLSYDACNLYFIAFSDICDFTASQIDSKAFFFKRLLTENPKNGVKLVLPMLEGRSKDNPVLKSSLATLRQHLLFVFEAISPDKLIFYQPIKNVSSRSGSSLLDTLYNVAKSSPQVAATLNPLRDPPDILPRKLVKTGLCLVNWFELEKRWTFANLVSREGGIQSLLLLLGRVVELGSPDSGIALALDIIFR